MEIEILKISLNVESFLSKNDIDKIRGYLGRLFWEDAWVHQHRPDGSFIYTYPRVQYKIIKGACILIGFNEGTEIIKKTFFDLSALDIGGNWKEITSKSLESYKANFRVTDQKLYYSFISPWLALNEKNYEEYHKYGTWSKRELLLQKILIGNIISIAKSLKYSISKPIQVELKNIKEVPTKLKQIPMLGFYGQFYVNFEIPDYLGIGKSVSRGFGTIVKCS